MKWLGQHIWDFISRFRTTVYLENLETSSDENVLVVDSDGKVTKNTTLGGADLTYNGSTANGVLTYGSASTIDVESTLTYSGESLSFSSSTTLKPQIQLTNTNTDANPPDFNFYKYATGADNDKLGKISFLGRDEADGLQNYASIIGSIADATNGQEAGKLELKVAEYDGSGAWDSDGTTGLLLDGDTDADGEVDVTIGAGAASTTTIAGTLLGGTLDINGSATAGQIVDIEASTLTTGNAVRIVDDTFERAVGLIHVNVTDTQTTTLNRGSSSLVFVNYERPSGSPVASGQSVGPTTGMRVRMDDNATNVGTTGQVGLNIHVDNANSGGITTNTGIITRVGGADLNSDIKMINDADDSEYALIGVSTGGATTIATTSDNVTGAITLDADGAIVLDADSGVITFADDGTSMGRITNAGYAGNRFLDHSTATDGNANGDIVYFGGTTSMTIGKIYHYKSDGTWEIANADAVSTCDGLLGVALGAASDTNGVLLRGFVTLDHDPGAIGDVLYVQSDNAGTPGDATATFPSETGDCVRVVGYQVEHASNGQIWFNPDNTWVEHA